MSTSHSKHDFGVGTSNVKKSETARDSDFSNVSSIEKGISRFPAKVTPARGFLHPIGSVKTFGIAIIAACAFLVWLLASCVPGLEWESDVASVASFGLVKDAVNVPAASATPGVLEDFQVYQPVLTPSGVTAGTITGDGSENTTTIVPVAATEKCEVLLMKYSFGYSYGMPFVGKCCSKTKYSQTSNTSQGTTYRRNVNSTE